MKKFTLIHAGPGNVGKFFARMVFDRQDHLAMHYGVDLRYCGVFGSKRGMYREGGLTRAEFEAYNEQAGPLDIIEYLSRADDATIFVDTTASDEMLPNMMMVLERGGYVVMSNKKPLTGPYETFYDLIVNYPGKVLFETTVGAGLPIMRPIRHLTIAGDHIRSIEGCLSGTLGYVCSQLERGVSYAEAVRNAKEQGFTEPDPRDDLSGLDVARKGLILSRMMGYRYELKDIQVAPLYDTALRDAPLDEFMKLLDKANASYAKLFADAKKKGNTYRYVASISEAGVTVKLTEISAQSPLGFLQGPENKVVISSRYYKDYPLVVSGPGAGMEVTAAGVFSDLLSIILPA